MLEGKKNLTNFENSKGEKFFLKSWKEEKKKANSRTATDSRRRG